MSNYFLSKENLTPITNGIPWVGCRVYKGMGHGMADASMADYPTGYWGATIIARLGDEWVLRFDETYGDLWDSSWRFDDPPESGLEFERTGREIVYYGEVEAGDEFYVKN